jgi:membrane protease YdiL (CAAX protease family)
MSSLRRDSSFGSALVVILLTYLVGAVVTYAVTRATDSQNPTSVVIPSVFALAVGLLSVGLGALRWPDGAGSKSIAYAGVLSGLLAGVAATFFALSDGHTLEVESHLHAAHAVTVAPIAEELLFTGFLYPVARKRRGVLVSTIMVAIVFTAVHLPPGASSAAIRFAHSVAACMLFEMSGTVLLPVIQHFLSNCIPYALAYLLGGEPSLLWMSSGWLVGLGFGLTALSALLPIIETMLRASSPANVVNRRLAPSADTSSRG